MDEVKQVKTKRQTKRDYTYAVGRRRLAVARVRIYNHVKEGTTWGEHEVVKNQILVNEGPVEKYFPGPLAKAKYTRPLVLTQTDGKFAITVKVAGGGRAGQLEAMVHGLSRALSAIDIVKYRPVLKKAGLLLRDARARQRRTVGTGGKARRQKSSPKR